MARSLLARRREDAVGAETQLISGEQEGRGILRAGRGFDVVRILLGGLLLTTAGMKAHGLWFGGPDYEGPQGAVVIDPFVIPQDDPGPVELSRPQDSLVASAGRTGLIRGPMNYALSWQRARPRDGTGQSPSPYLLHFPIRECKLGSRA
jgi:hypothetical protein